MIPVKRLIYRLQMRLNKVATNTHQSIPIEDLILALREAEIKVVKTKLNRNNVLKEGFDMSKKRAQDLQNLIVPYEEISNPTLEKDIYSKYKVDLSKLSYKFMIPFGMYTLSSKGTCSGNPVTVNKIIRHGDITAYMTNVHYSPSFEYQETICQISSNNLYIFTDGIFQVDKVYIEYLRYPVPVDIEGYLDFEGNPSVNQDSELQEYLEDEILDRACLELGIDTENPTIVQTDSLRNKYSE